MNRTELVSRFNTLYLGDSVLERIELEIGEAECRLRFNAGKVLKRSGGSIFEPEAAFQPASLSLYGVRSIACDGIYQLNSTVVDFGAVPSGDGDYIEFYFDLTGGTDADAFQVKVKILAKGFNFGPFVG